MAYERVAVTGGAGRLGSYIIDAAPDGQAMTAVDIAPPSRPNVDFVEADISDLKSLTAAFAGHDAVIHLAAVPNLFAASPEVIMSVNVQGDLECMPGGRVGGREASRCCVPVILRQAIPCWPSI